jgi:putative transposase
LLKLFEENGTKSDRNKNYKFWQTGNHAIELYSEKFVWDKINYIHNNPVSEKFVLNPSDWVYSSASNYFESRGILEEVFCLPGMLMTV